MGRKRNRKRKFIYFCIACLICLSVWGCSVLQEKFVLKKEKVAVEKENERKHEESSLNLMAERLGRARRHLQQRDYEASLKEAQEVLSLESKNPPGDEALFHLSLIYSHFASPKKDYGKSLLFLKRLIHDFPQSPLADEAKTWAALIQENEKLSRAVLKSNQTIERLSQTIDKLQQVIEESKQVDLEIEEKKREKGK